MTSVLHGRHRLPEVLGGREVKVVSVYGGKAQVKVGHIFITVDTKDLVPVSTVDDDTYAEHLRLGR